MARMKRMTSTVVMKGTNKEQLLDRLKLSLLSTLGSVFHLMVLLFFTIGSPQEFLIARE
jgi:hypothetical protein